jgi:hypothetical protein
MRNQPQRVAVDCFARGRAALKAYGAKPGARYIADFLSDGSIHLTPAVVMTVAEAARYYSPGL